MEGKRSLSKIDVHKDYLMWKLKFNAREALSLICTYMQETTPYGEEYIDAFKFYKKMLKELEKFEDKLAKCVEVAEDARKASKPL